MLSQHHIEPSYEAWDFFNFLVFNYYADTKNTRFTFEQYCRFATKFYQDDFNARIS